MDSSFEPTKIKEIISSISKTKVTPLCPRELEQMLNSEFYLRLIGDKVKSGWGGEKTPDGIIARIISRKPRFCAYQPIGRLEKVLYKDGSRVCKRIGERIADYLFILTSVELPDEQQIVLRGQAYEYDLHSNLVGSRQEQDLILYVPKHL